MWKVSVLLFVLGSASLWVLAEGASTARPEDDIVTTGAEDRVATPRVEDVMVTPGANENPHESAGLTAVVPTSAKRFKDLLTPESTVSAQEESQSTTTPNVATSRSMEKVGGETQPTIEKDGLATVTLVGIIVGVLLAIGFIGGIIFVVARKMSGRYSP